MINVIVFELFAAYVCSVKLLNDNEMEISVKSASYGISLMINADNVRIEHDVEERLYPLTDDGKRDLTKRYIKCVESDIIDQVVRVVDDLIELRVREYDSSDLIERLFTKLPTDSTKELLLKLNHEYSDL